MTIGFKVGCLTDTGKKRTENEDFIGCFPEQGLFIVSDGMGGHQAGEIASNLAVSSIQKYVQLKINTKSWNPHQVIEEAVLFANQTIFERSQDNPKLKGMGTTTTALLFKDFSLAIGHVGDSRCYFLKDPFIWQMTHDHSLVEEKLKAGLISRKEMKTDPLKNIITRSVGFEENLCVSVYRMGIRSGDSFLLCTDGLSGLVDNAEIFKIIQTHLFKALNPQKAIIELTFAANQKGGDDNISSILVQVF